MAVNPKNRWIETLEDRRLLSGVSAQITFQPTPNSISGIVFNDINGDGNLEAGEAGLAGFGIKLYGTVSGSTKLIASTTTDATGGYNFSNLAPGTYYVYVTNQTSKYQPTGKSTTYYQVKLISGGSSAGNNFGEKPFSGTPTPTPTPTPTGLTHPLVWNTANSPPHALAEAQSTVVNGKLYVFGGYNITSPDYQATAASEVYNPATNQWTPLAPMPIGETHMAVENDGKYIYVAGGYTYDPKTTFQKFGTANVLRYDIATNSWSSFVALPAAIGSGTLVRLGTVLRFFGGVNPQRVGQLEHWVLDLSSSNPHWSNAAPPPFSRNHTVAVVLNGKIYAVGGQPADNDSQTSSNLFMWDPAHPNTWTILKSMPSPRSHAVTAVVDGEIIVIGGTSSNDSPIASVIIYDPTTNSWSTQTALPSPRLAACGGVIGNHLIVTTGFGNGNLQATTWIATI